MIPMKKIIFAAVALGWLNAAAGAGEIRPGAVPGSINYQGRLERDNAPITGPIHLYFRIYNASSGGTLRWTSPEVVVDAAQGIFSAGITPGWDVFSRGETLYLEVQVESDILAPREPLNSVAYAIVAKKLEDGASVSVATFSAAYQVLLATVPGSNVGIGTNSPGSKLTVNGPIALLTGGIVFPDMTFQFSAGVGTAGGLSVTTDTIIVADSDSNGSGDVIVRTGVNERLRILNSNGNVGIGTASPGGKLDVDGPLYVGTEGIYDRDDGELNVKGNLLVEGGRITGSNSEYLALGETDNVIGFVSGGAERLRVNTNGYVGVNTAAPAYRLDVAGDIHTDTGLLAGAVSAGAYSGWPAASNEVRSAGGAHLLLQQNNPYNVGVGTDTPREKLHVRGSVRSDYGIIAATASFSGAVSVNGNFTANSGAGNTVSLSSTVIYGTLQVTGGIGSTAGLPAYLASSQTFTGQNAFLNQISVSSDILTPSRLGVAVKDFDFAGARYLQVGDNKPEYSAQNTAAYLVGGDAANARLVFYRGAAEAGSLETQGGANLALVLGGQAKTLTDSVYYRIQNSVVWISTGYNTTPAIYVSSQMGSVGIGTAVSDPNYRMTVAGTLRIAGAGNGIVFADGSVMTTASLGSASSLANSGDALVAANTGGGGGSVILRSGAVDSLVVDSGGNIGVGTLNPVSKLNVRGGDLVLGAPVNPYSSNGVEDLIVGGDIVFDGALVQRSASAAQFSGLVVAGDVSLSTGTGKKTGIGTNAPYTLLDVNGAAQFGQGVAKSTFTAAGALQLAASLGVAYGGSGADLSATGGANQFVRQNSLGGGLTVSAIADGDVPDNITINGTNNVTWASVNKTGSSLADLATKSAGDLTSGTLALARGGTGGTDAATARGSLGAAASGANTDITSLGPLSFTGALRLYSRTMPQLLLIAPGAAGELYFCSNCSPAKVVVSTGTGAGNFAAADGGTFQ